MLGCPRTPVPIATYIKTDLALLGIPFQLWLASLLAGAVATVVAGMIDGSGVQPLAGVVVAAGLMLRFRYAYRRDRHIVQVWRARYGARLGVPAVPLQPGWRPRGRLSSPTSVTA